MVWRSLKRQRKHFNDPNHKSKRLRINIFVETDSVIVTFSFIFPLTISLFH